jgi:hypothetical protein
MSVRKLRSAVICIAASAISAACAYTPGVSPDLDQKILMRTRKAVAILQMGFEGEGCMKTTIEVGRRTGNDFESVQTLTFFPVPGSAGDAAQFELPPGEYHIVSWKCEVTVSHRVLRITTLSRREGGNLFGDGARYKESYGSFSLAAGEIVNLGYLRMVRTSSSTMRLEVGDLARKQHEKLEREKPKLVAQMVTRLIKANPNQMTVR